MSDKETKCYTKVLAMSNVFSGIPNKNASTHEKLFSFLRYSNFCISVLLFFSFLAIAL